MRHQIHLEIEKMVIRIARKYLHGTGPLCKSFSNFHQTFVGNLDLILAHFNHPSFQEGTQENQLKSTKAN